MNAIYRMVFGGQSGGGHGIVYVGKGFIIGGHDRGGRFDGHYAEDNGKLRFEVTLTMESDGVLATGQPAKAGAEINMVADWPLDFADGTSREIQVDGKPVQVVMTKIRDIP